jgi:transposase
MSGKRYTEQFKIEAVKQVTERGYALADVAKRLGITNKSLYDWKVRYDDRSGEYQKSKAASDEIKALKAEVKRLTMERDILKEAAAFFAVESKRNTRS